MGEHARDPPRAILFLNLLQFNSAEKKLRLTNVKFDSPVKILYTPLKHFFKGLLTLDLFRA